MVQGLGFRVSGFRGWGFQGSGFKGLGLGFRVQRLVFRVHGSTL